MLVAFVVIDACKAESTAWRPVIAPELIAMLVAFVVIDACKAESTAFKEYISNITVPELSVIGLIYDPFESNPTTPERLIRYCDSVDKLISKDIISERTVFSTA